MNAPQDSEQIFGNFVASSLRNLRFDSNKRLLKRKIQAIILEIEETDDVDALLNQQHTPMPNTEWGSPENEDNSRIMNL